MEPGSISFPERVMSNLRITTPIASLLCVSALLLVIGPASTSQAKSKKRTVLMNEYDDARVGRESAKSVAAQIGVMPNAELNAYVNDIGRRLLRGVPRRSFKYQFSVVDQTEPNAFALPGGYVFISRGLLALANNEDELACVIGHEITHAAHRHAAAQQGLAKRGLAMGYLRAGQMASYSREMERDADQGGQKLCAAAGYDPMGMSTFLRSLEQYTRLAIGYSRGQGFFDSHPGSTERAAMNAVRAREMRWKRNPELADPQARLFARIDGLPVGQRPEAGIFHGDQFLHPDLDFQVRFPAGWMQSNSNMAVGAAEPRGDAVVFVKAELPEGEPREMAEQWVEKASEEQKLKVKESKPVKVGSISAWRMKIQGGGGGGRVSSFVTFIPYHGATWSITGMTASRNEKRFLGRTLSTARSFRPLREEERNAISSTKLRIVAARPGEGLDSIGKRSGNAWNVGDTAVFNGVFSNHRFKGGEKVKVIQSEPYRPSKK
jgi:predicted Zn-dependent protease